MVLTKNYVSRIPTSIESNSFSLTLCYRFSLFRTILLPVFFTIFKNILLNKLNIFNNLHMPAWHNGLARWTSNPKVVGSNPTVGVFCDYSDRYKMKSFAQFTRIVHLFNYNPHRHVRCFRGAIGFPFLPCLTKHEPPGISLDA